MPVEAVAASRTLSVTDVTASDALLTFSAMSLVVTACSSTAAAMLAMFSSTSLITPWMSPISETVARGLGQLAVCLPQRLDDLKSAMDLANLPPFHADASRIQAFVVVPVHLRQRWVALTQNAFIGESDWPKIADRVELLVNLEVLHEVLRLQEIQYPGLHLIRLVVWIAGI